MSYLRDLNFASTVHTKWAFKIIQWVAASLNMEMCPMEEKDNKFDY